MAGFRTFATGEVLTAANVNNFLMGQSVMRFADATARTAALGTDVVEGMLTYNLATDQLEVFDGTNFVVAAPEPPAGIGSNVVQIVKADAFASASGDFVEVPGLSLSFTPSRADSKVLLIASIAAAENRAGNASFVLQADGVEVPPTAGDRHKYLNATSLTNVFVFDIGIVLLHSPATVSAVTYRVAARAETSNIVLVNRREINGASVGTSSLTAIEVAA